MKFNIITIFPEIINFYVNKSILKRGQNVGAIKIKAINLRDFATDKHKTVDDLPYGGGAGMVLKPEPIYYALKSINALSFSKINGYEKIKRIFSGQIKKRQKTILLSPRGRQFDQKTAKQFSVLDELTLICGRYEGVDQRVIDNMIDEEISIGPYVLAGGELGALVIIETISRLIKGVLGNEESLKEETFSLSEKYKEYPQYTRPEKFLGWSVPRILLSGNHEEIRKWRDKNSK